MLSRNRLQQGAFVNVVPYGIPITIQYDDRGAIEKVLKFWDNDRVDISSDMLKYFNADFVPQQIALKGGSSWVWGVLETHESPKTEGVSADCSVNELIELFLEDPNKFKFLAFNVTSNSAKFAGPSPTRQWIKMAGFNLLPGYIVPVSSATQIIGDKFKQDFHKTVPIAVASFDGTDITIEKTAVTQCVCKSITTYLDESGEIHAEILSESGKSYNVYFEDIVKYNVSKQDVVYFDSFKIIWSSNDAKKRGKKHSGEMTCSVCGKPIKIFAGHCHCDDPDCMSLRYNDFVRLSNLFNIPIIPASKFYEIARNYSITTLDQFLDLEEFKDYKASDSLFNLLKALISSYACPNTSPMKQFAAKCTNTKSTFEYYITHPQVAQRDMELYDRFGQAFIAEISKPLVQYEIIHILNSGKFEILNAGKKFDGPPIFRNKTFYLTGTFKHGTHEDIESILMSYEGKVSDSVDNTVSAVILGDIKENVDGMAVKSANHLGIRIFNESEFFQMFEIDSDLKENLL